MELEGHETPHVLVFVDEAGFNLSKGWRRGRNLIGHRAITDPPGQRGADITMCAAISENGVSTHLPHIGPYNTQLLLAFLNTLYRDLIPEQERGFVRHYVVVWDNVSFHRSNIVRDCLAAHERITVEFLPPYSPFLNPIEEFFQYMIIDHKNAACEDITADHCRGWCGIQGDFLTGAWQWKTSDVMLRKIFDLTNKSDMSTKNNCFHGCYFVYLW